MALDLLAAPLVYDFTTVGVLPSGATLTRASAAWAFNGSYALTSYAIDAPRWTAGPGAKEWTPDQLVAGLYWWISAEQATKMTPPSTPGAISSWRDFVTAMDYTQATAGLQPVYSLTSFNGHAGVAFDGVDDALERVASNAAFPNGTTPCEIWVLGSQDAPAADGGIRYCFGWGDSLGVGREAGRSLSNSTSRGRAFTSDGVTSFSAVSPATYFGSKVLRAIINPTATTAELDGAVGTPASVVTNSVAGTGSRIGTRLGSRAGWWWGVVNSIMVTAPLNAAQVTEMYAYCNRRITPPPATPVQGLLIEASYTNGIRNASGSGAVVGTPGIVPTNWQVTSTADGVTRTIVLTGTESGIAYVDIQYSGTPSASGVKVITPETPAVVMIPAAAGQTWTGAMFVRLVGGSTLNTAVSLRVEENNAAGVMIQSTSVTLPVNASRLRTQEYDVERTLTDALTAGITHSLLVSYTSGLPINITLRVGLPQLGQGADVTSPVVTTGVAAVTRAADVLTLTVPNGGYQVVTRRQSGYTITPVTVSGGSYVVPPDPSPLFNVMFSNGDTSIYPGPATPVTIVADGVPVHAGPATPFHVSGAVGVLPGPAMPVTFVPGRPVHAGPATPVVVVNNRPVLPGPATPLA